MFSDFYCTIWGQWIWHSRPSRCPGTCRMALVYCLWWNRQMHKSNAYTSTDLYFADWILPFPVDKHSNLCSSTRHVLHLFRLQKRNFVNKSTTKIESTALCGMTNTYSIHLDQLDCTQTAKSTIMLPFVSAIMKTKKKKKKWIISLGVDCVQFEMKFNF